MECQPDLQLKKLRRLPLEIVGRRIVRVRVIALPRYLSSGSGYLPQFPHKLGKVRNVGCDLLRSSLVDLP